MFETFILKSDHECVLLLLIVELTATNCYNSIEEAQPGPTKLKLLASNKSPKHINLAILTVKLQNTVRGNC